MDWIPFFARFRILKYQCFGLFICMHVSMQSGSSALKHADAPVVRQNHFCTKCTATEMYMHVIKCGYKVIYM